MTNLQYSIGEYISRQNVIVLALHQLYTDTKEIELKTLDEINNKFNTLLSSLSSIYHTAVDNMEEHNRFSNFNGLEEYAHINAVALMATENTIKRETCKTYATSYEDAILGLKLLISDIQDIADMFIDNMEPLWNIKDKGYENVQ